MKTQARVCFLALFFVSSVLFLSGCAKVIIYDENGEKTKGLTFYESKTYLNLSYDTAGKAKFEFFWLPDHTKMRVARLRPGFGTASLTLKLANGGQLVEYGSTSDSKIPETITAVTGILKEVAAIAKKKDEKGNEQPLEPGIYEVTTKDMALQLVPVIRITRN